jgi:hypothetical protein
VRGLKRREASLFSYTTEECCVHVFDFGEMDKGESSYFMLNYLILKQSRYRPGVAQRVPGS